MVSGFLAFFAIFLFGSALSVVYSFYVTCVVNKYT